MPPKDQELNLPAPLSPESTSQANEAAEAKAEVLRVLRYVWTHAKGLSALFTIIGSLIAILALYTYLSAIDRVDLFLPSISIGPALFIWLFFVVMVFLAFVLCIATPSIIFAALISIFGLSDEHLREFAPTLAGITVGGFALLSLSVLFVPSHYINWSIGILYVIGFASVGYVVARSKTQRDKYLTKIGEKNGWYIFKSVMFIGAVAMVLLLVILTGIFPAIFTTWSHPELKSQSDSYWLGLISFGAMVLSCIPVLAFCLSRGALITRISRTLTTIFFVLILFCFMSPAIFSLVAYSAASAIKLRDSQVSEFIVSKKYPTVTFDATTWQIKEIQDENKTITIKAFKLFKFGDALLLCPAKYVNTLREDVPSISKYCFATSSAEMTLAAPTLVRQNIYLKATYCGREFTKPPFLLSQKQACVFAPSKLKPSAN